MAISAVYSLCLREIAGDEVSKATRNLGDGCEPIPNGFFWIKFSLPRFVQTAPVNADVQENEGALYIAWTHLNLNRTRSALYIAWWRLMGIP